MPMRMNIPVMDSSWLPRQQDALMLANLLRTSRLTVLHGEAGAGKSALLQHELLPLLRRRATDGAPRTSSIHSGVVVPFPDRRQGGRRATQGEVAVLFDAWSGDPRSGLLRHVRQALGSAPGALHQDADIPLADALLQLGRHHDSRLLIILDGFESHLAADPQEVLVQRFDNELADALNHPEVPAHFFIAVRDGAEPLLEPWRARVPGFGDRWLRIRHWSGLRPRPEPFVGESPEPRMAATAANGPSSVPVDAGPHTPTLVPSPGAPGGPGAGQVASTHDPAMDAQSPDLGIDLYLPLPPQASRPPSDRVEALWDQLLSRPVARRPPDTVPQPSAHAEAAAAVEALPDPPPEPCAQPEAASAPKAAPEPPRLPLRKTPWRAWSLVMIAIATLLIYAWGDSMQNKPRSRGPALTTGVEPARVP